MQTTEKLDELVTRYHDALRAFATGDAEPVRAIYSHGEDVMLANPFGPAVHGWDRVSRAIDQASSQFHGGGVTGFDQIASHVGSDVASLHELEHWQAKVGNRTEATPFDLRVTTTFRRESDGWKIVQRHADPITTFDPDGPLRHST